MKVLLAAALIALGFLCAPTTVVASPLEEGVIAVVAGDFDAARAKWYLLAHAGNPAAQTYLGMIYQYGRGGPKDIELAKSWYEKAGAQGFGPAIARLGALRPAEAAQGGSCPIGTSGRAGDIGNSVAIALGPEPVRINPDGYCAFFLWFRHCIFVRQAGQNTTLGPYCPPGAAFMKGATLITPQRDLPRDTEWAWSAQYPFTAYIARYDPSSYVPPPETAPAIEFPPLVGSPRWQELCAQKYKSFNPDTGLYTGKSGQTHACTLP